MACPTMKTRLTPQQRESKRSVDKNLENLNQDIKASDEFLTDIDDKQVDDAIKKLSPFLIEFSETIENYVGVCDAFSTSFETPAKDVEAVVDFHLDEAMKFQKRCRKLKGVLFSLRERKSTTTLPIVPDDSKLVKAVESLIKVQSETQQQTHAFLKASNTQPSPSSDSSQSHERGHIHLPKLSLPTFDGNVLKFTEFMDMFSSTIHKNARLSNVEKLSYLKNCLKGEAQDAISGYLVTEQNYEVVLDVIATRFGEIERTLNAHYTAIMDLPPATNKTASLRAYCDQVEEHLRSLEACGQNVSQHVFVAMILSKLPQHAVLQLELQKVEGQWEVHDLRKALRNYVAAKESAEALAQQPQQSTGTTHQKWRLDSRKPVLRQATETLLENSKVASSRSQPRCFYCTGGHFADECPTYNTVDTRKAKLDDRCIRCLRKGHLSRACTTTQVCFHCKGRHHRSLCTVKFPTSASTLNTSAEAFEPQQALLSLGDHVYMQTAVVKASHGSRSCNTRLLFDTGATRSYVTAEIQNALKLPTIRTERLATASFGCTDRKQQTLEYTEVTVQLADGSKKTLSVNVVPTITSPILKLPVDTRAHPELRNFHLAEPLCDTEERVTIDILVGGDFYHDLVLPERVTFSDGLILLNSKFGYICAGKITTTATHDNQALFFDSEPDPLMDLQRFWATEDAATLPTSYSVSDTTATEILNETVTQEAGRYVVKWPWRLDAPELPDNFGQAYGRLSSLLKRLRREPEKLEMYDGILKEQMQKGIIEEVDEHQSSSRQHYLPHHCVAKDSTTTKLRLVYDASARLSSTSPSLNDCLYRGPVLLPDLAGVLLRFRLNKIAISSDVEKAFLQLSLAEEDRDVTRFLWVRDVSQPPSGSNLLTYRFCRVPFGVISSPFLLAATIKHHLLAVDMPTASSILANTYVDNVLVGVDSVTAGIEHYHQAKSVFRAASMNLREWATNSSEIQQAIPDEDKVSDENQRVLGLKWNTITDHFSVADTSTSSQLVRTKRELLQAVAQFFDPLGIHSPLVVKAKLLLQDVWRLNIDWDERLPESIVTTWKQLAIQFDQASQHTIPRLCSITPAEHTSLHVFCDASQTAYAATAYLCSRSGSETESHLILSRSKLAPLHPSPKLTIPKMELMAAALGAKLITFLKEQLPIKLDRICLWSDSTCVLGWINSQKDLPAFVQRRVVSIRQSGADYGYVPSTENPADLPSRGTSSYLSDESLWWHGPDWLSDPLISEPEQPNAREVRSPYQKKTESSLSKKRGSRRITTVKKKKKKRK